MNNPTTSSSSASHRTTIGQVRSGSEQYLGTHARNLGHRPASGPRNHGPRGGKIDSLVVHGSGTGSKGFRRVDIELRSWSARCATTFGICTGIDDTGETLSSSTLYGGVWNMPSARRITRVVFIVLCELRIRSANVAPAIEPHCLTITALLSQHAAIYVRHEPAS